MLPKCIEFCTVATEKPDDHEGFVLFDPELSWIDLRLPTICAIVEEFRFPHMSWVRLFELLPKLEKTEAEILKTTTHSAFSTN